MVDGEAQVGCLSRVVETSRSIQGVAAGPENENHRTPAPGPRLLEQSVDIMRAKRSLEAVKEDEKWSVCLSGEVMKLQKITVGRIQALAPEVQGQSRAHEFAPERLKIWPREPPCRGKCRLRQEVLDGI